MRFFWILIIITIASIIFYLFSSSGLELIIPLFIIDFISLWYSIESKESGKTILAEKIENLEKLTWNLFNKLTGKQIDKKELTEWLSKF